jgi:O-antigen/teichoic acid export membrane protein
LGLVVFGYQLYAYVSVQLLLGFFSVIIGLILLNNAVGLNARLSIRNWSMMFHYGSKSMLSQLMTIIDLRLDIYVVNYFSAPANVGTYTVAGGLASMFWVLPNSISSALFPRTASSNVKESSELTALLCRNSIWQTIILGGIFLVLPEFAYF